MKKPLLITIIILVVILALPAVNFIRWAFQEKKPMNIVILDKTVPTLERTAHHSLVYVLTNSRFVKKDKGGSYSANKDYYGFFPLRPVREKQFRKRDFRLTELIELADNNDALYYADTYGVFFNDWYQGIKKARRSRKLYGGMNNNDYLLLSEMKLRDKLVILEYNAFDYPTAALERYKTEELLGITSTGWMGKHYSSLDTLSETGVPGWMPALYRKQYMEPWSFSRPGVVLLKDNSIIVLEEGKHLSASLPEIITSEIYAERFKVPQTVTFENEFDIISAGSNNVVSTFNLRSTPAGDSLLTLFGLQATFPAVVQEPAAQHTYYFSGDFTTISIPYWTAKFKSPMLPKGMLYSDKQEDTRRFFWLFYKPLVNGIFTEYSLAPKK